MKAYKLMRRLHDGNVYPLFINKTVPIKFGEWQEAHCYPTKGFAIRTGWHMTFLPYAPHLKEKLSNGEQRVWVECEIKDGYWTTYNRPESQGGRWILSMWMKPVRILSDKEVKQLNENRKEVA